VGGKALVYKQKVADNLSESYKHLDRLNGAFDELILDVIFPISRSDFLVILDSKQYLAYNDQIIYRFSKLQDCMGAKLFKSVLVYQGENTNKPFLDILSQLERLDIIDVDEWFEIRDLRNEIAHDYAENELTAIELLNAIYHLKNELRRILDAINKLVNR